MPMDDQSARLERIWTQLVGPLAYGLGSLQTCLRPQPVQVHRSFGDDVNPPVETNPNLGAVANALHLIVTFNVI